MENQRDGKKPAPWLQALLLSPVQARILLLAACLVIFTLALIPSGDVTPVFLGVDKIKHLFAFLVLTVLAHWSWPSARRLTFVLCLTLFGILIELAQGLSRLGRTASLADILADLVGIGLGLVVIEALRRLRLVRATSQA